MFDPGKRERGFRVQGPVADLHDSNGSGKVGVLLFPTIYVYVYTIGSVSRGNKIRGAGGATPGKKTKYLSCFCLDFWRE